MSKKASNIKANGLTLKPKAAKQLAEIDKIISTVPDKDKDKLIKGGLSVKQVGEKVTMEVDIKEIIPPACFVRSKASDNYDDFENIAQLEPIEVATTEDKKRLVVVAGERRLRHAKQYGKKKVKVQIIGTVVCQSQIWMARGKEMVKFKKPMTRLELAHGLMQLEDQLKRDFGENAFFGHGGDRKADVESKKSLSGYIAKTLGLKESAVKILIRFGRYVGPAGLAGLLTKDQNLNISLMDINTINGRLKNADLPKQIDKRTNELIKAGASQDVIIDEAGKLASTIIFQASNELGSEDNDNNDDDNAEEIESSDLPSTPKWSNSKKEDNDNEVEDAKPPKKKIKPNKIVKIISDFQMELKKIKEEFEDCKHIDEIDERLVEAKWKRLEGYWGKLCVELGDAGLC